MDLVLLDIDGVLSPVPELTATAQRDEHGVTLTLGAAAPAGFAWDDTAELLAHTPLSRACADRLARLDATRLWVTSWGQEANRVAEVLGWEPLEVLWADPASGWWKLAAVTAVLEARDWERAVWCDDDLDAELDTVTSALEPYGDRVLLVCPDKRVGLSPDDLVRIEAHLSR